MAISGGICNGHTPVSLVCGRSDRFTTLHPTSLRKQAEKVGFAPLQEVPPHRGFHIGDTRLGGVRIFDTHVKIQHDAQWRASNYQSRLITHF